LSPSLKSSTRRWLLLGVLLAAGVLLASLAERSRRGDAASASGSFSACAPLDGDAARACYQREMSRELVAVGGTSTREISFAAPSDGGEVTFTSAIEAQLPLLCDLHARVGAVDPQVPSWLGWTATSS
jgi:hypothetical protein